MKNLHRLDVRNSNHFKRIYYLVETVIIHLNVLLYYVMNQENLYIQKVNARVIQKPKLVLSILIVITTCFVDLV
jgi:hypothetical protein